MGSYPHVYKMCDQVKRAHLKGVNPEKEFNCSHPVCKAQGLALEHLQHVRRVHGITLREPKYA